MIKSNPYVYPYKPFKNLRNKNFSSNFTDESISTDELISLVKSLPRLKTSVKGKTTSEKIFSIFVDENVIFGPKKYVLDEKKSWLAKIGYFVEKNKPIQMTILGFPFKMPVQLKTDRKLPDLGEVLSLKRLKEITDLIAEIYPPGAKITIITEGVFGSFNNMESKEYEGYEKFLKKLTGIFGYSKSISFASLSEMEKLDNNFDKRYLKKIREFTNHFQEGDKSITRKYEGAKEPMLRIVNTRDFKFEKEDMMDAYNFKQKKVSPEAQTIRKHINEALEPMIMRYLAYLALRDELGFLSKRVPNSLTLTVSPKPGRLGIIPVSKEVIRLPYHSVPVMKKNKFLLEYLVDIQRTGKKYTRYFWPEDNEKKAFFYKEE